MYNVPKYMLYARVLLQKKKQFSKVIPQLEQHEQITHSIRTKAKLISQTHGKVYGFYTRTNTSPLHAFRILTCALIIMLSIYRYGFTKVSS